MILYKKDILYPALNTPSKNYLDSNLDHDPGGDTL